MPSTTIHLLRHGEVFNPGRILYGRLPGYRLSERGEAMAQRIAGFLSGSRQIDAVISSPLERAQQTATAIASAFGLPVQSDDRLVEADNYFEGMTFGFGDGSLRHPRHWPKLRNPFRPSWGEAYRDQVARMTAAIDAARRQVPGREAVLVSHQLPIWVTRLSFEGRHLWHDPRSRSCSLASLTTLHFDGDTLAGIEYLEPAADLLPGAATVAGA
jgi:broad specificity phosphatase PhoE